MRKLLANCSKMKDNFFAGIWSKDCHEPGRGSYRHRGTVEALFGSGKETDVIDECSPTFSTILDLEEGQGQDKAAFKMIYHDDDVGRREDRYAQKGTSSSCCIH